MVPVVKTAGTILFSNQALGQARRRGYNARVDLAQDHNRRVWDERVQQGRLHTRKACDKEFENPLKAINGRGWITAGSKANRCFALPVVAGCRRRFMLQRGRWSRWWTSARR